MQVPACSVCVFDKDHLIIHLSIYTDRYRMAQQLTPPSPPVDANVLVSLIERALRIEPALRISGRGKLTETITTIVF